MDRSDLIKYAALAGAAWLVYTWWKSTVTAASQTGAGKAPGQPAGSVSTGTQQYSDTIAVGGAAGGTPSGTIPSDPNVRMAVDLAFATSVYPGPLYNVDQWNYFRHDVGGRPIYDAAVLIEDEGRARPITAVEYHQRMATAAKAGATTLAGLGFSVWQARMPADHYWLM